VHAVYSKLPKLVIQQHSTAVTPRQVPYHNQLTANELGRDQTLQGVWGKAHS